MKKLFLILCVAFLSVSLFAQNEANKKNLYQDPNEYFSIFKPDGWKISEYQEVSRGKVKFIHPSNSKINVIIVGQPNPFSSFQDLMEDLKKSTKQMEAKYSSSGVSTSISNFEVDGVKYARRDATFSGFNIKQMSMECIINNTYITIGFVAPISHFDENLSHIFESISTITTSKKTYSNENIKSAIIESKLKQAKINIQNGRKDWALKAIEEGLEIDPGNKKLLELKKEIE